MLESLDILAEIATKLRAKVSGGYASIQAEVEAEVSAKLGITKKSESETKSITKETLSFVIPKWTETKLVKTTSISDMRQSIEMKALLDASVIIVSWDDWAKTFDSLHGLELYLRGGGGGTDDSADNLNRFMLTRAFEDFSLDAEDDLTVAIETDRIARNTVTGGSERVDTRIKHKRKGRRHAKTTN